MDPRLAQWITETVDNRVDQLLRARPRTAYGTVAIVDIPNSKASVYLSGDTTASEGFSFNPDVGNLLGGSRVRVVIDPRGDRYIDQVIEPIVGLAFRTANTSSTDNNKWTKVATTTISGQFQVAEATFLVHVSGSAGARFGGTVLAARAKQQNAFGTNPNLFLKAHTLSQHDHTGEDFYMVVTQNTPNTVVDLYMKVLATFERGTGIVLHQTGNPRWEMLYDQPFVTSLPAGLLNTYAGGDGGWHEIGAAGEPSFLNSWANYGGNFPTAAYRIDGHGYVHLKGLVRNGTAGHIFTLNPGYRPTAAASQIFSIISNGAAGRLDISSTGVVAAGTPHSSAWVSLDGVVFYAGDGLGIA